MKLILEDFPRPCEQHNKPTLDVSIEQPSRKVSFTVKCTVCELAMVIPTHLFTVEFLQTVKP